MQFSPAFPPTYRGFVLRKAPDSVSWSRVIRREFLVSDDMVDKTKLSRRNRPVEEIYDALSLNQRGQIDQLVAQANLDETNPLAEWKFASIEFSRRTHGFGKVIKATQIRVILKKVPRIHPNPRVQQAAKEYAVTGRDR